MMEVCQLISYFFTNGIRIFGGFFLVSEVLLLRKELKKPVLYSICLSVVITLLQGFAHLQTYSLLGLEILLLLAVLVIQYKAKWKMGLFLLFFYEIGIVLWEFLISVGLAILTKQSSVPDEGDIVYPVAVWIVRGLMIGLVLFLYNDRESRTGSFRLTTLFAVVTLVAVVAVSEQSLLPLNREVTSNWMLMTVILLVAILVFHLSSQYEKEAELARLKTEQAELIKNDYQNLNQLYTANAKLYHDLHNHLGIMHGYLTQNNVKDALAYLEDLHAPIQEIVQTVWTGDEAVDYLLNSKLSLIQEKQIRVKTNIEFPRNTSIRSAALTTILGNLLDNAIEAAQKCNTEHRFINLTIRRIHNILIIKVENGFEEQPILKEGAIESLKEDKNLHGWGIKSARTAAESYDGSLETSFANNVFSAVATLFF